MYFNILHRQATENHNQSSEYVLLR